MELSNLKHASKYSFLLLLSLMVIGLSANSFAAGKYKPSTTVSTAYGDVAGSVDTNGTLAWKSIPYANPPERFEPPVDPEPWEGTLDATDDCEKCAQKDFAINRVIGSEDCLYLNIWRPNTNQKNLPVFFWIHGGGNNTGSMQDFNGSLIAEKSNVVFVAIQYRLGPLGWLTHPGMRDGLDPLKDSGDFGLLDIIKALEWVQENIGAFGGKADNVTIAGESAGGRNVLSLLASPLANGLFHKAISQSGSTHTYTMAEGDAKTDGTISKLLANDGLTEVPEGNVEAYLEIQPLEILFDARISSGVDFSHPQGDGVVVSEGGPVAAIQSGNYNQVPIILGSNLDEMKYFMPHYGLTMQWAFYTNPEYGVSVPIPSGVFQTSYSWLNLNDVLGGTLSLDDVLTTEADKALYEACAETASLKWRFAGVDNVARALREHQSKVYAYQLQWDGADYITNNSYSFIYGAAHATDISFFFGADSDLFGGAAFGPGYDTPGRQQLGNAMMKYVAQFVRSGNPNYDELPVWKKWSNKEGKAKTIVFDATYLEQAIYMINEEVTLEMVSSESGYAGNPNSVFWGNYFELPPETANALFFFDWNLF